MILDNDIEKFINSLNFTKGKYNQKEVFKDVISLAVYYINATILNNREYANKFDDLIQKYNRLEQKQILEVILNLIRLYDKQKTANDIMTEIFSNLEIGNKNTGQFFTPTNISQLITKITSIDEEKIKKEGYITLNEPCSGAGGMLLACARELESKGYNTYRNLYVEAWDIDVLCTYMTYLQLSMYDIPAKVINGDTLSLKENFVLYTPAYYIFKHLKKEGKLKEPICAYCKKVIEGKPNISKINNNKKLCSQCYATETKLLLMKKIMESK